MRFLGVWPRPDVWAVLILVAIFWLVSIGLTLCVVPYWLRYSNHRRDAATARFHNERRLNNLFLKRVLLVTPDNLQQIETTYPGIFRGGQNDPKGKDVKNAEPLAGADPAQGGPAQP
jgi:hypothetical protein